MQSHSFRSRRKEKVNREVQAGESNRDVQKSLNEQAQLESYGAMA